MPMWWGEWGRHWGTPGYSRTIFWQLIRTRVMCFRAAGDHGNWKVNHRWGGCCRCSVLVRLHPSHLSNPSSFHLPRPMDHSYQHTNMRTPYAFQQRPHFSACIHVLSFFSQAFANDFTKTASVTSTSGLQILLLPDLSAAFYFPCGASRTAPSSGFSAASLQLSLLCLLLLYSLILWCESALGTSSWDLSAPSTRIPWVISSKVDTIYLLMASKCIVPIHTSSEVPTSKFLHITSCLMSNRRQKLKVSKAQLLLCFLTMQTMSFHFLRPKVL